MSGGKKKRKDINRGVAQSNQFANQAVARIDPFAQQGVAANNQLAALLGIGSPSNGSFSINTPLQAGAQSPQDAANNAFLNSLFFTGGEKAFGLEKDAIDSALSNSGLLFSQARLNAVEDARQRNFQNAFGQFLNATQNQAALGANAASGQANILTNQGQNAFNAGLGKANTRRGFLGTLSDIASIGGSAARGFGGF